MSSHSVFYHSTSDPTDRQNIQPFQMRKPIKTRRIIPSCPGKLVCSSISHDTIELKWNKPEHGAHNITTYLVFYHSHNDPPDRWIEQKVKGPKETAIVSNLTEKTIYSFKVQAECLGSVSYTSEPVLTKMTIPSQPDKPRAVAKCHS